jgi:hypothetical protein
MGKDADFDDTLMHVSGHIFRDELGAQVKPFKQIPMITPTQRSESPVSQD